MRPKRFRRLVDRAEGSITGVSADMIHELTTLNTAPASTTLPANPQSSAIATIPNAPDNSILIRRTPDNTDNNDEEDEHEDQRENEDGVNTSTPLTRLDYFNMIVSAPMAAHNLLVLGLPLVASITGVVVPDQVYQYATLAWWASMILMVIVNMVCRGRDRFTRYALSLSIVAGVSYMMNGGVIPMEQIPYIGNVSLGLGWTNRDVLPMLSRTLRPMFTFRQPRGPILIQYDTSGLATAQAQGRRRTLTAPRRRPTRRLGNNGPSSIQIDMPIECPSDS